MITNEEKLNDNSQEAIDVYTYLHKKLQNKRILPDLKGEQLHKFKNEFNTIKQILYLDFLKQDGIAQSYPKFTEGILYDLALNFAVWGAYNLHFEETETEDTKID